MATGKRAFGRVRKLPSGRWQVRYPAPDGLDRPAPSTFRTKKEATDWLADKQAEIRAGAWVDPDAGKIPFGVYAAAWIKQRRLEQTTRELYDTLLRRHLVPSFGAVAVADITPAGVRLWRAAHLELAGAPTVAKSYALLRAVMNTAVEDQLITRNPCRIKGGSVVDTPERPTATVAEVFEIAEAMQPRYRLLVLLAGFLGLRWGELIALRGQDVDLEAGTVRVRAAIAELRSGERVVKPPKSRAGVRTVAVPEVILPSLRQHMLTFAESGRDGRVFVGAKGATPRRNHFNRLWHRACDAIGIKGLHFHDLRHTGNTLTASTGASTKELMARFGHSTTRAALIYQHATEERQRTIADALNEQIIKGMKRGTGRNGHGTGTTGE
ncbi:site-specific integrase [Streptacidiphilus sp. PB12-B1b]|uniref:tyrosine-type recombinase/integrase n=1 Tax=Streptacidiphilus sp. PB12-B1b TaxID=2705012 RepID=UPI0015F7AA99|nr:site-specific integrase [Streptacidiphilus sp. PB12-B1b]QMU75522.1 site-specific integrase [Streptacidiphilus sp. PB12-B1b]